MAKCSPSLAACSQYQTYTSQLPTVGHLLARDAVVIPNRQCTETSQRFIALDSEDNFITKYAPSLDSSRIPLTETEQRFPERHDPQKSQPADLVHSQLCSRRVSPLSCERKPRTSPRSHGALPAGGQPAAKTIPRPAQTKTAFHESG